MNVSKRTTPLLCAATLLVSPIWFSIGHAYVALPQVFADYMVLQAGAKLPVWGTAAPGEQISVSLGSIKRSTTADEKGNWQIVFPPKKPSTIPATLSIRGDSNKIQIEDVLVGEVWICAGQSNMEWPLEQAKNGRSEIPQATHPNLRLLNLVGAARGGSGEYTAEQLERLTPTSFCRGSWTKCTPASAKRYSAVAYFFGSKLNHELNVPIGLISPAIGGTPTEAWIRCAAMANDDELAKLVQGDWLSNPKLEPWCQQRAKSNFRRAQVTGEAIPGDALGPNHSFKPGFMWGAGIKPLLPFAMRGVIWYQGESNAESHWRAEQHAQLLPTLVRDWRAQWGQGDFPFLYVQLPALGRPHWPLFREGQRRMLEMIPNAGLIVTMDVGHPTNVHPTNKRPVGDRLASWALSQVYAQGGVPCGPMFSSMQTRADQAELSFEYAAAGLATNDQLPPAGFEVAGRDGAFVSAEARIVGNSILVSSERVPAITHVRYGWAPYPDPPLNLVNTAGLPASPFSTANSPPENRN